MRLTQRQGLALLELVHDVAEASTSVELRRNVGARLLDLLEAEFLASYVWSAQEARFTSRVAINMDDANLRRYESYYQFHDPITHRLQRHRHAVLVDSVMAQRELERTEFFSDFLARDGLCYGLNYFAWAGSTNLGDLRIWRSRSRGPFSEQDRFLLEHVGRSFTTALSRAAAGPSGPPAALDVLTPREREVALAVAEGLTDREVAERLSVTYATVRTHLQHAFDKLHLRNRTELCRLLDTAR